MTTASRDPWQEIYDELRARITSGDLAPGLRLMETELATEFDTSRGPVRSALKELARTGLVVSTPRRGTFVLPMSATDVDEIFSLFGVLAPFAYQLACERMTGDDLAHLRELLDSIEGAHEDLLAWSEAGQRFQRAIFVAARHSRLLMMWDSIQEQGRVLAGLLAVADPGGMPDVADFHSFVFEALARRDAQEAELIVQRYVRQMREAFALGAVRSQPLSLRGRPEEEPRTILVRDRQPQTRSQRSR